MRNLDKGKSKLNFVFYKSLIKLFLILFAISSFFLGLLWIGLNYYESTTPNGALEHYASLVANKEFEEIYDESLKVYSQYNQKDAYIEYLSNFYEGKNLSNAAFTKKNYTSGDYLYYDMSIDGEFIVTLEIKKDDKKNKWNVRTLPETDYYIIESFVSNPEIFINDYPIEKDRIRNTDISSNAFKNLDDLTLSPKTTEYYIDNMIEAPQIKITNSSLAIAKDALSGYFYLGDKPSTEDMEEYTALIEKVAKIYCMYITEDETFANLRKLLYTKTSFYDAIRSFNNGFFSSHDKIEFSDMNVFDVVELGEDGLIGSVSFDYVVYIGERSQTYSNTYQLTFLKVNEKWLLTNLVIDDTQ